MFWNLFLLLAALSKVTRWSDRLIGAQSRKKSRPSLASRTEFCCFEMFVCCLWLHFLIWQGGPSPRSEPSPVQNLANLLAAHTIFGCLGGLFCLLWVALPMWHGGPVGRSDESPVQDAADGLADQTEFECCWMFLGSLWVPFPIWHGSLIG